MNGRHALALAAAALVTGVAWMTVVPSFEGTDELYFYNRAREFAAQPQRREPLFYRITAPVIRALSPRAAPVAPEYNPAFAFVSNQRGEVNRFVHERPVAPREHVRTLMALRGVSVAIGALTILLIYAIALLALGDGRLALLVACICLWIPQFSFVMATVHAESFTRVYAAAVTLLVVAYATGRLTRAVAWAILPASIALVPFADRQALFLVPFVALSLVAVERTWRGRAIAATAILVPVAIATRLVFRDLEAGTDLSPWFLVVLHPLQPFTSSDPTRHWLGPGGAYYALEFVPKLFMGFWGWLGQPSILLPAWTFAALFLVVAFAAAGLVVRIVRRTSRSEDRGRRLARGLMAAGVALMCLPIVYGPALAGLNLWYGRWLFAMLGPIVIGIVIGVAAFVAAAERSPHRIALVIGAVGVAGAVLWFAAPGAALRSAIDQHHYGDRTRLIASVRDVVFGLIAVAAAVEAAARLRLRAVGVPVLCAALAAANAAVLFAFVRPLYAPLTADDYVALITKYLDAQETTRAANVYVSAVESYPRAPSLRALPDRVPSLLLGGRSAAGRAMLWQWLARGNALRDREGLLMLADDLRREGGAAPGTAAILDRVLSAVEGDPDLEEPAALVRLGLARVKAEHAAKHLSLDAWHGHRLARVIRNGEATIEGFTTHPRVGGGTQVIVYFYARGDVGNRRLWLHAYPVGAPSYLTIEPTLAPEFWEPDRMMWALFELPPGEFTIYAGVWVGSDIGEAVPFGPIPS